jgi:hypothetical protein
MDRLLGMSVATPLVFRPSAIQRTLGVLLFAGSWLVGIRALFLLTNHMPRLTATLRQAMAMGEPTVTLWIWLTVSVLLCLAGGMLLFLSLLGLIVIEGTQVVVDETGITVDHAGLPRPIAKRLGAGHLPWKHVLRLNKGHFFFILGGGVPPGEATDSLHAINIPLTLKFMMVDELERLILIILERSPNLTFS